MVIASLVVIGLLALWLIVSPRVCTRVYYRFLFHPHKQLGEAGELAELAARHGGVERWFHAEEGHKLHAYSFGQLDSGAKPILYAIGRDGDIARRARILDLLLILGRPVFIYEHSGYGDSKGKPSLKQLCSDAETAFDELKRLSGRMSNDIILFGESFGGAVLAQLLRKRTPAALILKSSFASFITVAKELCPFLYLFPRALFPHPRMETVGNLAASPRVPMLIVHGKRDEIARWHHAEALKVASRGRLVELVNSRHSFIKPEDEQAFVEGVRAFLSDVDGAGAAPAPVEAVRA